MKMHRIVRTARTGLLAVVLTACRGGGGGGGGGGSGPNNPTYTVGGTVAGLSGTLVLQDNGADDLTVTASGPLAFSTALASGAAYAVTVRTAPAGKACAVGNGSGNIGTANVMNVTVTCASLAGGALDATFGSGGKVLIPPGSAQGVVVQPDGKFVVLAQGGSASSSFTLVRFNPDSTLDATFGVGGQAAGDLGGMNFTGEVANSLALQSDGKLVVAGWKQLGGSGSDIAPALARYNADGSLDATFGAGDQVSNTALVGNFGGPARVTIQADGKIVMAKNVDSGGVDFALSRYNANGSPDLSFGNNGVVTTDLSGGNQDLLNTILIQSDGKVIVAGYSQGPSSALFALARYLPDGSLDTSFGSGGKVLTDFGLVFASCTALATQPDGKIIAVGGATDGTAPRLAVARYMP